jgi:hypothetical protein
MKALSLWQPWASAMAMGLKTVETRCWGAAYRGQLAIHAAKRWTRDEREFAQAMGLPIDLPLGAVVAVGTLEAIHQTDVIRDRLEDGELAWGNYAPGRFAWVFRNIRALPHPVPCLGRQGFFEIPDDMLRDFTPDPPRQAALL